MSRAALESILREARAVLQREEVCAAEYSLTAAGIRATVNGAVLRDAARPCIQSATALIGVFDALADLHLAAECVKGTSAAAVPGIGIAAVKRTGVALVEDAAAHLADWRRELGGGA